MTDPRISIIDERLKNVRNIVAVSSGKGGVGKSLLASTLALILAQKGCRTGLFDVDFTGPSTHIILNVKDLYPKEENGIIPPEIYGLKYMSMSYYSKERPLPLRGRDVSNALIELLAVTLWGNMDFLIMDMPPGISDAALDVIRHIRRVKFLIVTTPSRLAFSTVMKLVGLLSDLGVPIIGVIENMKVGDSQFVRQNVEGMGIKFLGELPFDSGIEEAIGNVNRLLNTDFSRKLEKIVTSNLKTKPNPS